MPILFKCTHCGGLISVRFLRPGETALCRNCNHKNIVPEESLPEDTVIESVAPSPEPEPPAYVLDRPAFHELIAARPLALPAPPSVPAKRAFAVVAFTVIASQVFHLVLSTSEGSDFDNTSQRLIMISDFGALFLYAITTVVVIFDMIEHKLSPQLQLNLKQVTLVKVRGTLLGYIGVTSLIVILASRFLPFDNLSLAHLDWAAWVLRFLVVVLVAPVCEEIMFRGYMHVSLRNVLSHDPERQVLSSVIFAGAHVFLPYFLLGASVPVYIFFLGFLLARLYDKSGSILPSIVLHAWNNGLVFAIELLRILQAGAGQ